MADARDLLAAGTPRPWAIDPAYPCDIGHPGDNSEGEWDTTIGSAADPDHAALIVAAVNEYEALLDVDEAARQLVRRDIPIGVVALCEANLLAALASLDGVRSAA